ncbi:MAG: zf-HC2 domain-containing protein [Planctomycetes bacterium]|nr:zf-HC2 domain-containing protein [Planctomycetota bacterium]
MNCRRHRTSLKAWIDGELDAAAAARVEEHVRACRACREEAADFRHLTAALRGGRGCPAPSPDLEEIRSRIAGARLEERRLIRLLQRTAAAAAAVVVASALLGTFGAVAGAGASQDEIGRAGATPSAQEAPDDDSAFVLLLRNLDGRATTLVMGEY